MAIYTRPLKVEKHCILEKMAGGGAIHQLASVLDLSKYSAQRPSPAFDQEFNYRCGQLKGVYIEDVAKESFKDFSYSIRQDQELLLFGIVPAKVVKVISSLGGICHVGVVFPNPNPFQQGVLNIKGYFIYFICFFKPNHDLEEGDEWMRLVWGNQSAPKKDCPECKGAGKVTLFQHIYACSLCGDGKRL